MSGLNELKDLNSGLLADAHDWLGGPYVTLRPYAHHPMRAEICRAGSTYTLRVEVPGVDPEKDLQVTVSGGILTVTAERHENPAAQPHSEFRYGTLARSFRLPVNADEQHIEASYGHGVLEVAIGLLQDVNGRHIPVRIDHHIKPT
jgi:HSP20 family protein